MGINLDKVLFDPAAADDTHNVGAYVRSADGTLITHTTIGLIEALDVNIAGASNLGIFDEDSAHNSGDKGQHVLAVRNDTPGSLVSADGDYAPLQVDADGRLRVFASLDSASVAEKAEDAAHVSGDVGSFSLAVRQDTPASSTSADGDYQAFKSDAQGRLWVNDSPVTGNYGAVSVGDTATDLFATDLANRKFVIIQNVGNKSIWVGMDNSVTTLNGVEIAPGSSAEFKGAAAINWHAIAPTGQTVDVRVMQFA